MLVLFLSIAMSDFDDIPALGDTVADESVDESVYPEVEESPPGRKFRFNGIYLFVTWSKSTIDSKQEFQEKLLPLLPPRTQYFGGRELHEDGTPHYHVVFRFETETHWSDAYKHLSIEGDTNAIRIEKPRPRQPARVFLENTMAYCPKEGDVFGERLSLEGPVSEQKKRKWQEIIDEQDEGKAWGLVRDLEPRAYMVNFPALERAMTVTKRVKLEAALKEPVKGSFRVPEIMTYWMEKYVIHKTYSGRPKSLIIIGDPMIGKSMWAESFGNPIVMNSGWCLKSCVKGASHVVVSDVRPAAFGYAGKSYWREVLGGKSSFNCRDFQQETRTI